MTASPEDRVDALAATMTIALGTTGGPAVDAAAATGAERYALGSELGRGGLGRVCEAQDLQFGRVVAVKDALMAFDDGARQRLLVEALVTGNLEHPGVPAVYERGVRTDGTVYYVMRKIAGRTLTRAIEECESPSDRLRLVRGLVHVAETIAFAHERGVIHRDLKPDNILLGSRGEVFVVDWGIAKVKGLVVSMPGAAAREGPGTQQGSIMGTPPYMAPEQARGEVDAIDERTDVFAIGAMLYHLLTGRAPYDASNVAELIRQATTGRPPSVRRLAPHAHPALLAICERAMAPRPEDRYRSALELAQSLDDFQSNAMGAQSSRWSIAASRGIMALSVLLVLAVVVPSWLLSSTLHEQGPMALIALLLGATSGVLAVIELKTAGDRKLWPLGIALMAGTLLGGMSSLGIGMGNVFNAMRAPEVLADALRYREILALGMHEALGVIATAAASTAAQALLWAFVWRRNETARRALPARR